MPRVESSAISQVGYQPRHRRLYVTYRGSSGGYVYLDVPPRKYDRLMQADSKGAFINKQIKPYHKCQRLEDVSADGAPSDATGGDAATGM